MKKKIVNVLNWLKSRKTAFLSCFMVVCVGCSVLAASRSIKRANAQTYSKNERSFVVQTYLPPALFYPASGGDRAMFVFATPMTFYIRSSCFSFSTGSENVDFSPNSNLSNYQDYRTQFLHDTRGNPAVQLEIKPVRAWFGAFSHTDPLFTWDNLFTRAIRDEYNVDVLYYNTVVVGGTVDSDIGYFDNNSARYVFDFRHKDNSKYDCSFSFIVSSMNVVRNTYGFKLSSNKDVGSGYEILNYFTVTTSIINVSAENQYEQGYSDGKTAGQIEGEQIGYIAGKTAGLTEGEQIGYNKGLNEKLQKITPWQTIVDGVNSFLNIELLPGVKVSVIISVCFGLVLLGLAIKVFLGG